MLRAITTASFFLVAACSHLIAGDAIHGKYVEARTCQVYTGPCFANGEVGSAGKHAIMTWQIDDGSFDGVDVSGQSVAVMIKASQTLGFHGLGDSKATKAVVFVNQSASANQAAALCRFVQAQTRLQDSDIAAIDRADIEMQFDVDQLTAVVKVGDVAHLETRKARKGDCICSNESAYYPPLTNLVGFVPGVTIEGEVTARKLGSRWSIPDSRTAYLGLFNVDASELKLAQNF